MPPKKNKDSKKLKQSTLFDSSRPLSKGPSKRRFIKEKSTQHADSSDGGILSGPLTVTSSDEDVGPIPSTRNYRRCLTRVASETPSVEEVVLTSRVDGDAETPKKRRRLQRRKPESDVDEDEDEVDEDGILESRLRTRNKKSFYQQSLEKLKRRKLKINDSEEDMLSNEYEAESSPFKGAKPSSEDKNLEEEEGSTSNESSDFIVEDNNSFQLPVQFSMESHQDISHQFKKIFQFFVHIAVRPSKKRSSFMKEKFADEEYFSIPLKMIRRKLLGIKDSLVASSVWKLNFKENLERYPGFSLVQLIDAVPFCDACQLGGRMSTLVGRLSGSRYDTLGFGPLTSDDDDIVDDDESTEFHLGRFCARRTQVYHGFCHWEYELFQSISSELEELRNRSGFHRVAYFDGVEPPDDLTDADALCDWLDQRQIINREWRKLESLMDSAHRLSFNAKDEEQG